MSQLAALKIAPDADAVVAGLYEATAAPELWPTALHGLAGLVRSRGALVTRPDRNHDGLVHSPGLTDVVAQFFEQKWHADDLRTDRLVARGYPAGFLCDQDISDADERDRSDYYSGFARSAGVPWFAAVGLQTPTGAVIGVSLQRSANDGPFEPADMARLRSLQPHLQGMLSVSLRIAETRDAGRLRGMEMLGVAAVLLDSAGQVRALNAQAQALPPAVIAVRGRRLVAADPRVRAALDRLIASACARVQDPWAAALNPVRLSATDLGAPNLHTLLAEAIPLVGAGQDLFGEGQAIVTFTPLSATGPEPARLQAAFGLTPTEAQVAALICAGLDTAAVAARLRVTPGAVRFHLKAILPKAGVTRQAALVAAAARLSR